MRAVGGRFYDLLNGLHTVQVGHDDIHQDHVRQQHMQPSRPHIQPFSASATTVKPPKRSHRLAQSLAHQGVIIGDEDS